MNITLERYFYPVGQGLCCRERFISENGKEFNLVYDCGQIDFWLNPRPAKYISERIEECFKNVKIDILYISHFHTDHINLLSYIEKSKGCCVKNVILPYLTERELLLNVIDNQVANNENTKRLLLKASGELTEEEETKYYLLQSPEQDVKNGEFFIHNGEDLLQKIPLKRILPFWKYLPFNNCKGMEKSIFSYLTNNLKNINPYDAKDVINHKTEIREIYDNLGLGADLNEQSTLLLSLPEVSCIKKYSCQNRKYISEDNLIGCIYFGDYPAQKTPIPNRIEKVITNNLCYVGTIQIPHHGACNGELPNHYYIDKKCPVSYGFKKNYPTIFIVDTILKNKGMLICVNEYIEYFQHFEFEV